MKNNQPNVQFDSIAAYVDYFRDNGISLDPKRGLQVVLNFQDFIGRRSIESTVNEILVDFQKDPNFQSSVCWVLSATLDQQTAGEIIKSVWLQMAIEERVQDIADRYIIDANLKVSKVQNDLSEAYQEIADLKKELTNCRLHYEQEQSANNMLRATLDQARKSVEFLKAL